MDMNHHISAFLPSALLELTPECQRNLYLANAFDENATIEPETTVSFNDQRATIEIKTAVSFETKRIFASDHVADAFGLRSSAEPAFIECLCHWIHHWCYYEIVGSNSLEFRLEPIRTLEAGVSRLR